MIVFDKFHGVRQGVAAGDEVRRAETRQDAAARTQWEKTCWLWRKNPEGWTEREALRWEQLKGKPRVTGLAFAMRLELQRAYAAVTASQARSRFVKWGQWVRAEAEAQVRELLSVADERSVAQALFLDWLRMEHGIDSPSRRLGEPFALSSDELVAEVRRARGKRRPLSAAALRSLREEHARTVVPVAARLREAEVAERELAGLVCDAYGLTPEEVELIRQTAPPRMPPLGETAGSAPAARSTSRAPRRTSRRAASRRASARSSTGGSRPARTPTRTRGS